MRALATAAIVVAVLGGESPTRAPITIFLAGDSTMAAKQPDKRPETGWGEKLQHYFDPAVVRVDNRAQNGRSTRSFLAAGLWAGVLENLHAGDYVFIQFGHNDEPKDAPSVVTPLPEFRDNLARMVADVRARQATPVLFTSVVRRRFDDRGAFYDTHGVYPDAVRGVATDLRVPLVDHQRSSEQALREYGADRSRELFLQLKSGEHLNYPQGVEDNTHFSPAGAELMARLAVDGLRSLKLGLADALRPK